MRIAVIGPSWGAAWGGLFARSGHSVVFAGRDFNKAKATANGVGHGTQAADVAAAVYAADIVVITVPFDRYPAVARDAGAALSGRIVIDTSSQINWRADPPEVFTVPGGLTAAQHQQLALAPARLVKAFTFISVQEVDELAQRVGYQRIAVPLAGDDDSAKKTVAAFIKSVGFVPVDVGGLNDAHLIELTTFDDWLPPLTEPETRERIEARRAVAMKEAT